MCGIIGYLGKHNAVNMIVHGLRRLEYRGYDSAGLAVLDGHRLEVRRAVGRIAALERVLGERPVAGRIGIGHTRWATHGAPSEVNAHPHADCSRRVVVVHNGILENYVELKDRLRHEGHVFRSETDTEVLAHLVERELRRGCDIDAAVRRGLGEVSGSYAVAVLASDFPDRIVVAKRGAGSVIIGQGQAETLIASDIPAMLAHTRDVIVLEDDELAAVTADAICMSTMDGRPIRRAPVRIAWDPITAEKGGYQHFMQKEIFEQPRAIRDTLRGRITPDGDLAESFDVVLDSAMSRVIRRAVLVGCGTSLHAALIGRAMFEHLAGIAAEVDVASEFRYRDAVLGPDTLVIAISQSGETADTLGAVKVAKTKGCPVVAITNVLGSAIARETTGVLYTHAGPEIGVASTKCFTTQLVATYMLALWLGRARGVVTGEGLRKRIHDLVELPELVEQTLALDGQIARVARRLSAARDVFYLGRGVQFPVALEAALKLKEISYIHAEAYAAGEMKHGPIALITDGVPVVALAPRDATYDRMLGNIEEVRARGAAVIVLANRGDRTLAEKAEDVIEVPAAAELLMPALTVIPLQLLAYHAAVERGCDVDQPRNLAKSVTVE